MKLLGYMLAAFIALGIFAAALKLAIVAIIALVALALIFNPRQSLGCLIGLTFLGLIGQYPIPMIILSIALVAFAAAQDQSS